jgi:hypothetical protein
MSGEHIWSDWMNALFPGKKLFRRWDQNRQLMHSRSGEALDWKAKVVCEPCNNTWMSNIESQHAMPAMSELIIGKTNVPISQSRASSIALFAFKSAVILDMLNRRRPAPFFTRSTRHSFRPLPHQIPSGVSMWLANFALPGKGRVITWYNQGEVERAGRPPHSFELYICSYNVGHFVFQVVAISPQMLTTFHPLPGFESLAVPFWPRIPDNFTWPSLAISSIRHLEDFACRWKTVTVSSFTGGV